MADDDLKQQLKELKAKYAELDARYKEAENEKKSKPEYIELQERFKTVQKEENILYVKKEQLRREVNLEFTDDGEIPYYSRSSKWVKRTNIQEHVLQAIQSQVKISLLTQDEIIHIVDKLILRAGKRAGIDKLREQLSELNEELSAIWVKQRDFETREMKDLDNEEYAVQEQIHKMEYAIQNPKAVKTRSDRENERAKARETTTIDAIEKDLFRIIKEDK